MTTVPFHIPPGLEHLLPMFQVEMKKDLGILSTVLVETPDLLAEHIHAMRGKCGLFGEDVLYGLLEKLDCEFPDNVPQIMADISGRIREICAYSGPAT